MYIVREHKYDDQFDEAVKYFARGKYRQQCFDKIERMKGTIEAANMTAGFDPESIGETLFYVCAETPNLFATIRTDDPCVSFTAMGERFVDGKDRLMETMLARATSIVLVAP